MNQFANEYETTKGGALSGGNQITEQAVDHISYINKKLESVNCVAVEEKLKVIDDFIETQRKSFEDEKEDEKKLWINVRFLLNHINSDGEGEGEKVDEPMNQEVEDDDDDDDVDDDGDDGDGDDDDGDGDDDGDDDDDDGCGGGGDDGDNDDGDNDGDGDGDDRGIE